jgi:hypothetical protein
VSNSAGLPAWVSPLIIFAAFCVTCGIIWDISWHISIGRDTFWTPAHMMVYLGGTVGGSLAGWLLLDATFFRRTAQRDSSISIGPLRGPLGAWICVWGASAMLISAPFDDWWHSAYGLDVKIISPPHMILAIGMYGIATGALFLTTAERNRQLTGPTVARVNFQAVLANGIQLALVSVVLAEFTTPNLQHTSAFAIATALILPAILIAAVCNHPVKWAATRVAAIYTVVAGGMTWVLPLFSAEPKLAPIYNHIDHMVPLAFPLLLIVPAIGFDLTLGRMRDRTGLQWNLLRGLVGGTVFVLLFVTAHWYFSEFLISTAADNWFFAGHGRYLSYGDHRGPGQGQFWGTERSLTANGALTAWGVAIISSWLGASAGTYLARLRR